MTSWPWWWVLCKEDNADKVCRCEGILWCWSEAISNAAWEFDFESTNLDETGSESNGSASENLKDKDLASWGSKLIGFRVGFFKQTRGKVIYALQPERIFVLPFRARCELRFDSGPRNMKQIICTRLLKIWSGTCSESSLKTCSWFGPNANQCLVDL